MTARRRQQRRDTPGTRHRTATSRHPTVEAPADTAFQRAVKRWLGGLAGIVGTVQVSVIGILLGLQPAPHDIPVFQLVREHPLVALAMVGTILLIIALGLVLAYGHPRGHLSALRTRGTSSRLPHVPLLAVTSVAGTTSTVGLVALVGVLLARPTWCPSTFCTTAPPPGGTYDANVAAVYTTMQSTAFAILDEPSTYSLGHLPPTRLPGAVPAQQIVPNERAANASPYRIQLSVRNLHSSGPDIFIEDVALMVDDVRSPPSPARAWVQPVGDANLLVNPFLATYQGQPVGFAISGRSQGVVPEGHVRLRPAELDQLTLTITSTTNVSLRFHVRIRYRLTNELEVRTIVPKDRFAAVFADDHLWQPYHLVDGRLLPA